MYVADGIIHNGRQYDLKGAKPFKNKLNLKKERGKNYENNQKFYQQNGKQINGKSLFNK